MLREVAKLKLESTLRQVKELSEKCLLAKESTFLTDAHL